QGVKTNHCIFNRLEFEAEQAIHAAYPCQRKLPLSLIVKDSDTAIHSPFEPRPKAALLLWLTGSDPVAWWL
ncbi:MAG TPA: hypothetical protein VGS58_02665, partial [Candidatus Sulfopaludibacter sp.]|nr:hypothetical protein [Candidatus Sulfopaludibacter sp.]